MKTFILLTFGFLGFAFYEMSGGSEFAPASERIVAAAEATQAEPVKVAEAQTTPEAPRPAVTQNATSITKIDSTPAVTRVSLNLTSVTDAGEAATQADTNSAVVIESSTTPQIILPSLIATSRTNGADGDVRKVSGNRVNVRGGPSTDFGVVTKLARGDEVRILEDNGNGWVRMQPLDGGKSGWMADFLLTSG